MSTITYKILGQSHPAAATNTDLYTVGTGKQAIISSITIANVTGSEGTARIWVRKAGATAAHVYALMYDVKVAANSLATFTLGLTLEATDVITVRSTNGNDLTFHAYGSEIA